MSNRTEIFKQIEKEREYQDCKWGEEFDNKNTLNDWGAYIGVYLGRATDMSASKEAQRSNMVKVAALSVAALEAFDRNGQFAPRHYE